MPGLSKTEGSYGGNSFFFLFYSTILALKRYFLVVYF